MATISFEIPDDALRPVADDAEVFARELRFAASAFWYGRSEVSMGKAAQIAGLNIRDFLFALSAREIDIFKVDLDDLDRELAYLASKPVREPAGD